MQVSPTASIATVIVFTEEHPDGVEHPNSRFVIDRETCREVGILNRHADLVADAVLTRLPEGSAAEVVGVDDYGRPNPRNVFGGADWSEAYEGPDDSLGLYEAQENAYLREEESF
jgi:hypothetical protein